MIAHKTFLLSTMKRVVLMSIAALMMSISASAEDLPWNDPPADRGYIPDGGDAPRNIAPDRGGRYEAPPRYDAPPRYNAPPPRRYSDEGRHHYDRTITDDEYSSNEILAEGHQFFGSISIGMAKVVEHAFKNKGRPNGYILGEEAGGAIIAGLRYGEGTLYTKSAGRHKVYWQGPSVGYDFGASGSKTMILVYNLHSPRDVFRSYAGVAGSAYLIGGVGITFLQRDGVNLAPIVSGVGFRVGANFGYLKFTSQPTWNPF